MWLTWLRNLGLVGVVLALGASLVCAELSRRLVETPFLRMKARYVPVRAAGVKAPLPPLGAEQPTPVLVGVS